MVSWYESYCVNRGILESAVLLVTTVSLVDVLAGVKSPMAAECPGGDEDDVGDCDRAAAAAVAETAAVAMLQQLYMTAVYQTFPPPNLLLAFGSS